MNYLKPFFQLISVDKLEKLLLITVYLFIMLELVVFRNKTLFFPEQFNFSPHLLPFLDLTPEAIEGRFGAQ